MADDGVVKPSMFWLPDRTSWSCESCVVLTGVSLVRLLCLFDAPAHLLDVLADVVVTELLLLDALDFGAPLVVPLLDALGDGLLDPGHDPFFDRSCAMY